MDIKQFQAEAGNTKSENLYLKDLLGFSMNLMATNSVDVFHAVMGISTEAGELLDPFKKAIFYNKPIDYVNLDEEVGDILWYIAIYAQARGTTIEQLAEKNNRKLRTRYPNKFSNEAAQHRDLLAERKALEI